LKRLSRDLDRTAAPLPEKASRVPGRTRFPPSKNQLRCLLRKQSGAKEDEYFRDGITEDIVTEISKIAQLEIFPRSEMLAFRDKPVTRSKWASSSAPPTCSKFYSPGTACGSTATAGGSLDKAFRLGERYDRQLEDVFAIQEEIARSIARLCASR